MNLTRLPRHVRMLKRIPGHPRIREICAALCGHLGAMSWMSRLIPVPFDFLSGGWCWVMRARKDRFPVEQAAAGTRPPLQYLHSWLSMQLYSSFVASPFVNHPILDYGRQLVEHSQLDLVSSSRRQRWLLGQTPAGGLCSAATYQAGKVRPENAFSHSWDGFFSVEQARISGNVCCPAVEEKNSEFQLTKLLQQAWSDRV